MKLSKNNLLQRRGQRNPDDVLRQARVLHLGDTIN
ncbi:hypothetical protein SRABI106_03553 [Rahnella aquatilis]|nr:hypothetical protein SRABI106_03553 [Rahnella aquatilis]